MDLIQFVLAIALLVICVGLFFCCVAFMVLLWKVPKSTQLRDGYASEKRSLFFGLGGTSCTWIWTLLQALLAFQVIPQHDLLLVQIVGTVFLLTGALLMISVAIQRIRNRNAQRRSLS